MHLVLVLINFILMVPLVLFLDLDEGNTYIFDQSDSSNATFTLALSSTKDGTNTVGGVAYTNGVTTVGTAGSSGAYTQIIVAPVAASALQYYFISLLR
jgi:hypothetical protein